MRNNQRALPRWSILTQALAHRRLVIECDRIPYRFESVSSCRLRNWFLAEISAHLRLAHPLGLPTHLQVEPTNRCNLRCPVCPTATGEMKRPRGSMSVAHFDKLMGEIGNSLLLLLLWEWGEPFLNDDLCRLIAAAKRHGSKVVTSTNGHFIQNSAKANEVVASGLDTLVFALDGISPESYRAYRRGGQFERVLEGIRLTVEAKRVLQSRSPLLVLQFIVLRHNEAQMASALDFAGDLGVDVLVFRTANPYHHAFEETCLPEDPLLRQFEYVGNSYVRKRKPNRCKRFWNMPAIHWDGTIAHCEFDVDGEYELGNAFRGDFAGAWLGEKYTSARRAFALKVPVTRPCRDCVYNYSGVHDIVAGAVPLSDAARLIGVR